MKHLHQDILPLGVIAYNGVQGLFIKKHEDLHTRWYFLWQNDKGAFKNRSREVTIRTVQGVKEQPRLCSNFQFSQTSDGWMVSYVKTERSKHYRIIAVGQDIYSWIIISKTEIEKPPFDSAFIPPEGDRQALMYQGGLFATYSTSANGKHWYHHKKLLFTSRHNHFDSGAFSLMGGIITDRAIAVIYDASEHTKEFHKLRAGLIVFSKDNPDRIIWRGRVPLWEGLVHAKDEHLQPIGVTFWQGQATLYWGSPEGSLITAKVNLPAIAEGPIIHPKERLYLKKHYKNPIIEPHPEHHWENDSVFNPAAVYDNGRVHLLYRAIGRNNISVLGYASSQDGIDFDVRHVDPAYYPRAEFEGVRVKGPTKYTDIYASGGGWGGCEDPKLTKIDDTIYLTYVAFNGWSHPRLAISEISVEDFRKHRWNWTYPRLMSRPNVVDKSGCLLPEKIDGKYVIFHRVFPDILIDFVDDLEFGPGKWLEGKYKISPKEGTWDSRKLSVGAPPIRTKDGWFVVYHAVDDRDDSQYKIGAMILDLDNPTKVLYRTKHPMLIPDMHYENDGKPGVAYPCGAVVLNNELLVYYGGGDKVVCVASAPLPELIEKVKHDVEIELRPSTSIIV